ncbi:hypothetical protein [Cupriavidus sp. PET2-C1]
MVNAASLRQQIGVVKQDNTLFACSICDYIASSIPGAPLEAVLPGWLILIDHCHAFGLFDPGLRRIAPN